MLLSSASSADIEGGRDGRAFGRVCDGRDGHWHRYRPVPVPVPVPGPGPVPVPPVPPVPAPVPVPVPVPVPLRFRYRCRYRHGHRHGRRRGRLLQWGDNRSVVRPKGVARARRWRDHVQYSPDPREARQAEAAYSEST